MALLSSVLGNHADFNVYFQGKLNRREFPTLTTLECDLRRMVSNAKSYNEKSSELFSDAEKIRKLVVSFMSQNNPAYETGTYTPYSTPVPPDWRAHLQPLEESHDLDADGETDPDEAVDPADPADPIDHHYSGHESFSAPAPNERRESSTPAVQDAEGAGESFEGNTFQQAQEKILTEMINLKNDELVTSLGVCFSSLTCFAVVNPSQPPLSTSRLATYETIIESLSIQSALEARRKR